MEAERFDETLNALRQRVPFHPFTIILANGNRYEVDHRDAYVNRDGTAIYVKPGGAPVIFDHEGVSEIIGDLSSQMA
jgi:hypothetical protein